MIRTVLMLTFWAIALPIAAVMCFPWTFITGDISFLYRVAMWAAWTERCTCCDRSMTRRDKSPGGYDQPGSPFFWTGAHTMDTVFEVDERHDVDCADVWMCASVLRATRRPCDHVDRFDCDCGTAQQRDRQVSRAAGEREDRAMMVAV